MTHWVTSHLLKYPSSSDIVAASGIGARPEPPPAPIKKQMGFSETFLKNLSYKQLIHFESLHAHNSIFNMQVQTDQTQSTTLIYHSFSIWSRKFFF